MAKGNVGSLLVFDPAKIDFASDDKVKSAAGDAVVGIVTERGDCADKQTSRLCYLHRQHQACLTVIVWILLGLLDVQHYQYLRIVDAAHSCLSCSSKAQVLFHVQIT